MTTPQIHLIDGNAVGFAAHMATKLSAGGRPTQAVFGIAKMVRELCVQYPGSKKFFLWDGRAQWRFDLYPTYKVRRNDTPEKIRMKAEYKKQQPDIDRLLTTLGIEQVRSPNCEADDLAAAYSFIFADKGWHTELITADKDWQMLVNEFVRWFDPIHDKRCDHKSFEFVTGYKGVRQVLDAKALAGDKSDCISGVGGIGEVGAKALLERFGRVPAFLNEYDKDPHGLGKMPVAWVKLAENFDGRRARYHRNVKLMELKPGLPGVENRVSIKGKFDLDGFRALCEELAFHSILDNFESWIVPFRSHE